MFRRSKKINEKVFSVANEEALCEMHGAFFVEFKAHEREVFCDDVMNTPFHRSSGGRRNFQPVCFCRAARTPPANLVFAP